MLKQVVHIVTTGLQRVKIRSILKKESKKTKFSYAYLSSKPRRLMQSGEKTPRILNLGI
jgi:hypothetical protein